MSEYMTMLYSKVLVTERNKIKPAATRLRNVYRSILFQIRFIQCFE